MTRKEATQRMTTDVPLRTYRMLRRVSKQTRKTLVDLVTRAVEKTYQDPVSVQREKCKALAAQLYHEKKILDDMEAKE